MWATGHRQLHGTARHECLAVGIWSESTETFVLAQVIGDPLNRSTAHGPQNHKAHLDKLLEYVQRGVKEGATLRYGGKRLARRGLFFEPTILTDVEDNMYVAKEESFGPIMIISKFSGK